MKRQMFAALAAMSVLALPSLGYAEEWISFEPVRFRLAGEDPEDALEDALDDLLKLSYAFRPDGARISDLRVIERGPKGVPRVMFKASRGVGFVRKSAQVNADIHTQKQAGGCGRLPGSQGYRIHVNTADSDELVAANVSVFVVNLCVRKTQTSGQLQVLAMASMKKGYDYGRFAGPAVRDLIHAQTTPLLSALKEVVVFYQHQ